MSLNLLREHQLAKNFATILAPYVLDIISISAANMEGWPDRMLQLENSRVVFVELKVVKLNKHGTYRLETFRPEQAAFMAKWQRKGGLCFLLAGLLDYNSKFLGYVPIALAEWRDWLSLSQKHLSLDVMTETELIGWFRALTRS